MSDPRKPASEKPFDLGTDVAKEEVDYMGMFSLSFGLMGVLLKVHRN
jgi:hypothetical protein